MANKPGVKTNIKKDFSRRSCPFHSGPSAQFDGDNVYGYRSKGSDLTDIIEADGVEGRTCFRKGVSAEFSQMSILPSTMDTIEDLLVYEVFHIWNDCCGDLVCGQANMSDFMVQVEAVSLDETGGLLIVEVGRFKQQG